jgi:hypothetical protein
MESSTQHCFRISGIPPSWTDVGIVSALRSLEPTIIPDGQHLHLSLYPACSRLTQTGLLKLDNCLEFFKNIMSNKTKLELSVEGENVIVDIDGRFDDLTPLNTPDNEDFTE